AILGTRAALGRTFTAHADLGRTEPEAVLSEPLWRGRFASDPGVLGRTVTLDGEAFTVVGVMPATFKVATNELAESRAEMWIPSRLVPEGRPGMGGSLNVVARLAPNVGFPSAEAELLAISARLESERPSYSRTWRPELVPLQEATVREARPLLLVVLGV